jgi:hypothetical protein
MKTETTAKQNALFLLHQNVLNTDQYDELIKLIDEKPNEAKELIKTKFEEFKEKKFVLTKGQQKQIIKTTTK